MKFIGKKGISPLIASVLLIGFTVALAAIVITWGGGFVERITVGTEERTTKSLLCTSDLKFDVINVRCPNSIVIENKGDVDIEGFRLRYFNSAGDNIGTANVGALKKYEIQTFVVTPPITEATTRVDAIATVIIEGKDVTCGDLPKENTFSPAC
ncbi:MAG: archaellin/type IV pilin N-terminal domain-containing protein [Nanoarchaeota archaeon]